MEKVKRNGKVAVLYSPGYGAGWYSWNDTDLKQMLFHPQLVEWAENGLPDNIDLDKWCQREFDRKYVCTLGWKQIKVEWVNEGEQFKIDEYDGYESIDLLDSMNLTA